jgi:uncharacterized lipoprotein YajG
VRLCVVRGMVAVAAAFLIAGCTASPMNHPAAPPTSLPPDPHTASALLKIAMACGPPRVFRTAELSLFHAASC